MPVHPSLGARLNAKRGCSPLHHYKAVHQFPKQNSAGDFRIPTELDVVREQFVFVLCGKTEFEDCACEIVGRINDVQFGTAEIMVLEVNLEKSVPSLQPIAWLHAPVN